MEKLRIFKPNFKGVLAQEKYKIYQQLKNNKEFIKFANWCANIIIATKDFGKVFFDPNIWTLGQWIFASALFSKADVILHLKARQEGGTTLAIAFDLFNAFTKPNLKGVFVGADWLQIKTAISIFREMYDNLPRNLRVKRIVNNVFKQGFVNGNYINITYPSSKTSQYGKRGRGEPVNYAHITEAAFLANEEDLASIEASFSTHYPHRKYVYETTANGINFFYDRWEAMKDDPSAKRVFAGWWAVDHYVINDPEIIKQYSEPIFTWENEKIKEVKERYGVTISDAQLAWWRRKAQQIGENNILKEFPFTEEDAFMATTKIAIRKEEIFKAHKNVIPPKVSYTISTIENWKDLSFEESSFGPLKVWEHWDNIDPYAKYVIGVDPAYAIRATSDKSCIQVLRCYKDKIYQCAEFASPVVDTRTLSAIVLALAFLYDAQVNIEVQGGGTTVLYGIQDLKKFLTNTNKNELSPFLQKVLEGNKVLKEYIYYRRDSLRFAAAKHTYTTADVKRRMISFILEAINNDEIVLRSRELLNEISKLINVEGDFEFTGRGSPDRVMALGLALHAIRDYMPEYTEEEARQKRENKEKNKKDIEQEKFASFNKHLIERWIGQLK